MLWLVSFDHEISRVNIWDGCGDWAAGKEQREDKRSPRLAQTARIHVVFIVVVFWNWPENL